MAITLFSKICYALFTIILIINTTYISIRKFTGAATGSDIIHHLAMALEGIEVERCG